MNDCGCDAELAAAAGPSHVQSQIIRAAEKVEWWQAGSWLQWPCRVNADCEAAIECRVGCAAECHLSRTSLLLQPFLCIVELLWAYSLQLTALQLHLPICCLLLLLLLLLSVRSPLLPLWWCPQRSIKTACIRSSHCALFPCPTRVDR